MVSIVIVVWNAKKYVIECLDSLQQYLGDLSAEVIVVDNASSDGSPDLVAAQFPNFKLIRNSENLGFAKANNIGIAQCSGDYVCLVNSDVKFTSDCITPLLRFLIDNPTVGMVGPKMLATDGISVRRSTMRYPTVWYSFSRAVGLDVLFQKSRLFGGQLMRDFDHQTTTPVEVLNGWFVLVSRSALERAGLLDPQFFMYGEDVDWCYRFQQAGEGVVFFAEAGAIHYGGASSANAPVHFYLEMWRANWQYWQKHHGWLAQKAFLLTSILHHGLRYVGSSLKYLYSPSRRADSSFKIKRSLVCLQWSTRTIFSASAPPDSPKASPSDRTLHPAPRRTLRSFAGDIRRKILCSLYHRRASLQGKGPVVSFTFDDFPRSAYSVGGAILQQFGGRGTYYTAPGLMNTSTELGELCRVEDLESLLEHGHELATQTFQHSSARALSLAEFAEDVRKGRDAVERMTGCDAPNFAYPYGHVTLATKKALGRDLASCRSNIPGLNGPNFDLSLLRANRLYGGVENARQAERLIQQAVERRSWVIFYTHDVRPEPSEYGCTPELLQAAVAAAALAGCRIRTVQEVLEEIGVQAVHPKGQVRSTVSA